MKDFRSTTLRYIFSLLLITQISGEYGQKSTVRGLSRGPGPGGGRNTNIGLVAKSLDATPESSSSSRVNRTVATTYREKSISGTDADRVPQEIFFLHAEEGYFGCQVNESTDVLQLYDVSKLCNGASECYLGSDENRAKLKCTNDCLYTTGHRCQNGACLDHQCYCNDGYGGKGCSMPDENECKYRPCDVFAHCTNTMGSFFCSCFPGYEGDGLTCQDIDECKIPELAAKCVENAECCNLPAHYVCKCNPGFEGDGEVECLDVDECQRPDACGINALCQNTPGNFTCSCFNGYGGNPYDGCVDIDECELGGACGTDSLCTNTEGGFLCECPPGFNGDAKVACLDINECTATKDICGRNANCANLPGTFRCECPSGFQGNPLVACEDIDECKKSPCGNNATCQNTVGSFSCSCSPDSTGDPFRACVDIDECTVLSNPCGQFAVCENAVPGYNCLCPQGYAGQPTPDIACEQVDVTTSCEGNYDCINNAECLNGQCFCIDGFKAEGATCIDVDECQSDPCGPFSICTNLQGSYRCECEAGFVGKPPTTPCKAPCEDVKCGSHATCKTQEEEAFCVCDEGWTYDPTNITAGCLDIDECDLGQGLLSRCGENAICTNIPGSFSCECPPGFSGNPSTRCLDIDECQRPSICGIGAICLNKLGSYACECPEGTIPEPDAETKCISLARCAIDDDCPGNSFCDPTKECLCPDPNVGNDCRHPCEDLRCTANEECMLINNVAKCICSTGFSVAPNGGCIDIDECATNPCAGGAICRNEPGKFSCECPAGYEGEPYRDGCRQVATTPPGCSTTNPCRNGEECVRQGDALIGVCVCSRGFVRDLETSMCRDINECLESPVEKPACGFRAVCKNLPGSYDCSCPPGLEGNPFQSCDVCDSVECRCQPPYRVIGGTCLLSGCAGGKQTCPPGAECINVAGGVSYCACPAGYRPLADGSCEDVNECLETIQPCGFGANCINRPGTFECVCPANYTGDAYKGVCALSQMRCIKDRDCGINENCIQPGECICPPPYFSDTEDGNKCKSPCERFACGVNSKCTPTDPPKCMCEPGHTGDPAVGCTDIDECRDNPCGPGAQCINENGGFKCRCATGLVGDPYQEGCQGVARSECSIDTECDGQLACIQGSCVNPCQALPCGANAYCEPEEHAAWCRCLPGFKENDSGVCISACQDVLCGQNAQCVVSTEGSTCSCLQGYNGNPFAGGSCIPDVCSAANPCQEPQVCVSGRCKERCEGVTCGVGARCDKATNQCVCLPFFIGKPELLCVPPVIPPICSPSCGRNAHCEYGLPNRCVCNPGTSGNPYETCGAQERSCDATKCGVNAECRQGINRVDCICPVGYQGNPYVGCEDVNECMGNACGANAVCLNTAGSYDCQCREGFSGNPFMMCMPAAPETSPNVCEGGSVSCDTACYGITCGPNSACQNGQCQCLPGFLNDPSTGGCIVSSCRNDLDCNIRQICLNIDPNAKGNTGRQCIEACSRDQCGPNALCVADNHRASCICQDGFHGNPTDLKDGCQLKTVIDKCADDDQCPGDTMCRSDVNGIRNCIDICRETACGQNEVCYVRDRKPLCDCHTSFIRNPSTGFCEKPSLPDCETNADCRNDFTCRPDVLGVRKCTPVCAGFTCPPNSDCRTTNHVGQCFCRAGFTGNPNDRNGCRIVSKDQCQTDAQCLESETCKLDLLGVRTCVPVCQSVKCGPLAICVSNNHAAQCQCPPGLYTGEPSSSEGCRQVQCLSNTDCSSSMSCDRKSLSCIPVCVSNSCGLNAICLAENHMAMCSCPNGYEPNPHPEIECIASDLCRSESCHSSAQCDTVAGKALCTCPVDTVGDPYTSGCRTNGTCPNGNKDCPSEAACSNGRCINPCDGYCGPNTECRCTNHIPVCSCPPNFAPNPTVKEGCIRKPQACRFDGDCSGSTCLKGQCQFVCRNENDCAQGERCIGSMCMLQCLTHSQCASQQACVNGLCKSGCRSNNDCPTGKACFNTQCENPCEREGVCGINALCQVVEHSAQCQCPKGFIGGPTAQEGCMRAPSFCQNSTPCPSGMSCDGGRCYPTCRSNTNCAEGERCIKGTCIKVCYSDNNCLSGEVCIDGGCRSGCRAENDCATGQVCINSQCKCATGYKLVGSSCVDVNECDTKSCHFTAVCTNTVGSFRCSCPEGTVGDGYSDPGCVSANECEVNTNCGGQLACLTRTNGAKACADPCASASCGPNAICTVIDHQASCSCPTATRGDPNDQSLGCFRVDCSENDDCAFDHACDQKTFKCFNPCERMDCFNGLCQVKNRKAVCQCAAGFEPSINNQCADINECSRNPCHPTATCRNTPGKFQCVCPEGLVGEPYKDGCRKPGRCVADSDCPLTASCISGTCKDPCSVANSCGINAECFTENHTPVCRCPFQAAGDAKVECYTLECVDSSDCSANEECVNSKCKDACSSPNACGRNSQCSAINHRAVCECKSGFTGSPSQGCVALVYCATDAQCPTSQSCVTGLCVSRCQSSRECLSSQQCIEGKCRPACSNSDDCPEAQICIKSVCIPEMRCRSDQECGSGEVCRTNSNGQADCQNPCQGPILCGRNAVCNVTNDRQAVCRCQEGFFGNPQDDKVGCLRIECRSNEDCSDDKSCHNNRCKIACMVQENVCGDNTLCFSEKHTSVCKCQPGFTGNANSGCTSIDFCGQTPCAAGALCQNTRGSYKCLCPAGTVGEPYEEGCQASFECSSNKDCSSSAVCGTERGRPKCKDACSDVVCGVNADCQAKNHQSKCVCRQGFEGDAELGCVREPISCTKNRPTKCPPNTYCDGNICQPACQADSECTNSQACIRGQCIDPCLLDNACGMNANCYVSNHMRTCSCPEGFTGTAEKECIRIPTACQKSDECSADMRCLESRCIPKCEADIQCALNEKCISGNCMLTCRLDHDCFLSHVCLNGMCTIGCRVNEDCSTDESCVDSRCRNPCSVENVCGPNAICNPVDHRAQCTCPSGFLAYPSPNVACVRQPSPCTNDKNCPSGSACRNTVCRPLCLKDEQCLSNERCSDRFCVPVCRQDSDCRSGELCSSGMCQIGCRADLDCPESQACLNSQCSDPCQISAVCGTNTNCRVINHRPECSCLDGLVGNAKVACRYAPSICSVSSDCDSKHMCIGGMCKPGCSNDQGCLSDSRCVNGACSPVCNSDAFCDRGHICLDRVCIAGCRNDATCPTNQACLNNNCTDPCELENVCGSCAKCNVVNHAAQCTCPAGTIGNPQLGCFKTPTRCSQKSDCVDGAKCLTGFCAVSCSKSSSCDCGETCVQGRCRLQCNADNQCPQGQMCRQNTCVAGCRSSVDCAVEEACLNGRCSNPCKNNTCGSNAECRVSDHRPVCLCPNGFGGNPTSECIKNECQVDTDCDMDNHCLENQCVNPCLVNGACGINAMCRVVLHKPQCLCPPGYYGNAQVQCKIDVDECQANPCGANAVCKDTVGSFTCTCNPGCIGDAVKGCLCTAASIDPCSNAGCGINAECRTDGERGVCYCPSNYPSGNPRVECSIERPSADCQTEGCGIGANCVAEGKLYVCRCLNGLRGDPNERCSADRACSYDSDCPLDQACKSGQCQDPCSLRGACGENALCRVVIHKARCSCPQCYVGRPTDQCIPDPRCVTTTPKPKLPIVSTPRPGLLLPHVAESCISDSDCTVNHACNRVTGSCQDPCEFRSTPCDQGKRCEVRRHRPVCICKHGFIMNEFGEMSCGPSPIECRVDDECASNLACVSGRCQSPCAVNNPCLASNKSCQVLDHRPVCICVDDCKPSVSICLRDRGCPSNMACVNYQCVNPCDDFVCPENRPCYVQEHKAICKFCPTGFSVDPQYGCIKGILYMHSPMFHSPNYRIVRLAQMSD